MSKIIVAALLLATSIVAACAEPDNTGGIPGGVYYHPATGKYRDIEGERVIVPGDPIARRTRRIIHRERYERYERREERHQERLGLAVECKPPVHGSGKEHDSIAAAKRAAMDQWRIEVRYQWGERFLNPQDATYQCDRSSTNESVGGRVAESVGQYNSRCRVIARPCTSPPVGE